MAEIHLSVQSGFSWTGSDKLKVRGYIFNQAGEFLEGQAMLDYFSEIDTFTDFQERVVYANGMFSVVCISDKHVFAACDPLRTFPLFYARYSGRWLISDDLKLISDLNGNEGFNHSALTEASLSGLVTGSDTLLSGIRKVQAGEAIFFTENGINRQFYHSYRNNVYREDEYSILKEEGKSLLEIAISRVIKSLDGMPVAIFLGNDFESRLIAAMLKLRGVQNVTCLHYGVKDKSESLVPRRIAESLGFNYYFFDFEAENPESLLTNDDFFKYAGSAGLSGSGILPEEFLCLKGAMAAGAIGQGHTILTGFPGDFLAGNSLNKSGNLNMEESSDQIAQRIYRIYYNFRKLPTAKTEAIFNKIERTLYSGFRRRSDFAYSIQEDWEFKEQIAAKSASFASCASFFNLKFRNIYADRQLVDFFRNLPLHAKVNKYLLDDLLTSGIFEAYKINFPEQKDYSDEEKPMGKINIQVKNYLPDFLKRPFSPKPEKTYTRLLISMIKADLMSRGISVRGYSGSFPSVQNFWHLDFLKNLFTKIEK